MALDPRVVPEPPYFGTSKSRSRACVRVGVAYVAMHKTLTFSRSTLTALDPAV
jgi:hypothetical protein